MLRKDYSYIWYEIYKIAFIFFFLGTKSDKEVEIVPQKESFYIFPHEPSSVPVGAATADIHCR